jgi:hypothetical protein
VGAAHKQREDVCYALLCSQGLRPVHGSRRDLRQDTIPSPARCCAWHSSKKLVHVHKTFSSPSYHGIATRNRMAQRSLTPQQKLMCGPLLRYCRGSLTLAGTTFLSNTVDVSLVGPVGLAKAVIDAPGIVTEPGEPLKVRSAWMLWGRSAWVSEGWRSAWV